MIAALALLTSVALAKVDTLDVSIRRFMAYEDAFLSAPEGNPVGQIAMSFGLSFDRIYWANAISSSFTSKQFRDVEWSPSFGVHVSKGLDLEYAHTSRHLLDLSHPQVKYPDRDSIGIVFHML